MSHVRLLESEKGVKFGEGEWQMLISADDFTKLFNTMITVIVSPKLHQLLMNVGMIVDDLGPCRTYTGRELEIQGVFFCA